MASPYAHSQRAVLSANDTTVMEKNRRMRDTFMKTREHYENTVKHARTRTPKDTAAIEKAITVNALNNAVEVRQKVVTVKKKAWLDENRVLADDPAIAQELEQQGWSVRRRGAHAYAYSPEYTRVQKLMRKASYEHLSVEEVFKGRIRDLDAPYIKPGFTTAAVQEGDDVYQVYKPVTGPDNQYPAWMRRYIKNGGGGNKPRDVVFYDIGVLKVPGEKRATRVSIYKEGKHFEVFVPALNDKLVRSMAVREPVHISDVDAHLAVARYHKMADRAREKLQGSGAVKRLPRTDLETDGGYSQVGYLSVWDAEAETMVMKPLHAYRHAGKLVPYITDVACVADYDNEKQRVKVNRKTRHIVLDGYGGGVVNGHESHAHLLIGDTFTSYKVSDGIDWQNGLKNLRSFNTHVATSYKKDLSPGHTIDYTRNETKADIKPVAELAAADDERVEKIVALQFRWPAAMGQFTHDNLSMMLFETRMRNAAQTKMATMANNDELTIGNQAADGDLKDVVEAMKKAKAFMIKRERAAEKPVKRERSETGKPANMPSQKKPRQVKTEPSTANRGGGKGKGKEKE